MHIFLTGEKRVGKTTTLKAFLSRTGATADGFVTYWEKHGDKERRLYLARYGADPKRDERYLVAPDEGDGLKFTEDTIKTFDIHGSEILGDSGKNEYIIMDELGFLETKSPAFRQMVMHFISGDVPILGVLKSSRTEFLDAIRAHPKVIVREVTAENRDKVLQWLLAQHKQGMELK
jgi:nucleoside-triphosphatase